MFRPTKNLCPFSLIDDNDDSKCIELFETNVSVDPTTGDVLLQRKAMIVDRDSCAPLVDSRLQHALEKEKIFEGKTFSFLGLQKVMEVRYISHDFYHL